MSLLTSFTNPIAAAPLSTVQVIDDFVSGTNSSAAVGDLGWFVGGGSTTALAAEAGRPGIVRRDTSTTGSTVAYTSMRPATGAIGSVHADDLWDVTFVFRLNQVDANTRLRVGVSSNWSSETPNELAHLERLTGDTNWFFVTNTGGGTATRADSGTAANTSWHRVRIRRISASQIGFTLDAAAEVIATATLPTGSGLLIPGWQIVNTTTASKTVDVDLCIFRVTGLSR